MSDAYDIRYREGYQARLQRRTESLSKEDADRFCPPYPEDDLAELWKRGWREACNDLKRR